MEIIYKGTLYTAPIVSPYAIDGAILYNLATQSRIETILTAKNDNNANSEGLYEYDMELTPAVTASIPQGIYNLELFSMDADNNPIIQAYYENYAKVKESSFTQDYA
jgi:hypothetical protein